MVASLKELGDVVLSGLSRTAGLDRVDARVPNGATPIDHLFMASADFRVPPLLEPGHHAAIVAPSSALATIFPHKRDLGLQRLRTVFCLEPVLLPSASASRDGSPAARARDLVSAFADPAIHVVICTIGGDDLIRLMPYLADALVCAEPKALVGFSDITALHLLLWKRHRVVSYYGGNLLCQFAMGGAAMHPYTVAAVRSALFLHGPQELTASAAFLDGQPDWADRANLLAEPALEENVGGWQWSMAWDRDGRYDGDDVDQRRRTAEVLRGRL